MVFARLQAAAVEQTEAMPLGAHQWDFLSNLQQSVKQAITLGNQ